MAINCIDISTWNSNVNYRAVRSGGIPAAILRAGFGREVSQIDSQFENHYKGCRDAGLKIGIYWYSYADSISDAETEARACLAILNGRRIDLPVYFDMEEAWQTSLGMQTLTAMAERFCETIKRGGYKAGVYSNLNWFYNYLDYDRLRSKYSIWLAQWSSSHSLACDIWQYTENGNINGVNGNVDINIIENTSIINGSDTIPTTDIPDTATVQRWLNKVYNSGLAVDNIYGDLTRKAIIMGLQRVLNQKFKADLAVDGIFGRATKAAVRPLQRGAYGGYPSILQAFLICHGYDTGGFDGDFGAQTEKSVRDFQYDKGLYADGIAGKVTFAALAV